jgi:hypothetical protein
LSGIRRSAPVDKLSSTESGLGRRAWTVEVMECWLFRFVDISGHGSRSRRHLEDEDEDDLASYETGAALRTGSGASDLLAPDAPLEIGML